MKILISPDKFKGSLNAVEVSESIEQGVRSVIPETETMKFPLADGGDGTASLLTRHFKGELIRTYVHGPLFTIIEAEYGYAENIKTAFIEMSSASGIRLIPDEKRNPLITTTFGTGELIMNAVNRGAKHIILGIGGSATNDAGIGMACALGYKFFDENGKELIPAGENLVRIGYIDGSDFLLKSLETDIQVACDVDNPLFGKNGAAYIYSPQKGATDEMVKNLDEGLKNFARIVKTQLGKDVSRLPGSGAAGGLGAGAVAFLGAIIRPGIDLYIDITGFEESVRNSDLIFTGEGKLDEQTFHGKVIDGVTKLAEKHKIPVLAVCGEITIGPIALKEHGISGSSSLVNYFGSHTEAIKNARSGIKEVTRNILIEYLITHKTSIG